MKKVAMVLSCLLIFSMLITGCGTNESTGTSNTQTPAESTAASNAQTPAESTAAIKQVSGSITVWSVIAQTDLNKYLQDYNSINPNVKVKAVSMPSDQYMTKLEASLRSGAGAPDVMTFEIKQLGALKNTDYLENLSSDPYNVKAEEANIIPYVAELSKDSNGNFKGLAFQSCPGGFWYNRKFAKEYLGTDDPAMVSDLVSSTDKINELCKTVTEKSGGKVHLFDSVTSVGSYLLNTRDGAYVDENNKLYDRKFFVDVMTEFKTIRDNNGDAKLEAWSAPWQAAFYKSPNFILLGQPTWGLQYCIKANTPETATGTANSWGLADAPVPYESGGTWLSMYSKSKNKDAAWDFIKTINLNSTYLKKYVDWSGDMVSYIPAIEEIISSNFKDEFTGDQPIYESWYNAAKNIKAPVLTKYDDTVESLFYSKVNQMLSGKMTIEAAVDSFQKDLKTQFPEIVID